jgi:hypothetical protein
MTSSVGEGDSDTGEAGIAFAEFLESVPPLRAKTIIDLLGQEYSDHNYELTIPEILIHCPSQICNGNRIHRRLGAKVYASGVDRTSHDKFLSFLCSNCRTSIKTFAVSIVPTPITASNADEYVAVTYKYGENPPFGPITPTRLLTLLGDQRSLFLKGRRCENQGLGIGAFGYYRRVVENQKNQILNEIIRVSQKLGLDSESLSSLEAAKSEIQFLKSMTLAKQALPQSLLINGHNPLTLLHAALSSGLHNQTDEKCLELAHDVRIVLGELSERLSQALKDEVELNSAVGRLLRSKDE